VNPGAYPCIPACHTHRLHTARHISPYCGAALKCDPPERPILSAPPFSVFSGVFSDRGALIKAMEVPQASIMVIWGLQRSGGPY
jgi:hypothetical protein